MSASPVLSPAASNYSSGSIRRFPTDDDGQAPREITALLGAPQFVHHYQSFAEQCHLGWLFGSAADKYASFISYESALVVVTSEAYIVIPWAEITEFLHTVGFRASNGARYTVGPDFTNYGPLYVRLQNEILTNVLPQALVALEEGKEWVFEPFSKPTAGSSLAAALGKPQLAGPLAISTAGIRYQGELLAWDDVASIQLTNHRYNGALCSTTLAVRKNNALFAALKFDFKTVPNSFLLTELLPYVCPQRLLVPKSD